MTRLKRILAIVITGILLMAQVPPVNAEDSSLDDAVLPLYAIDTLEYGESYALLSCDAALSARIVSTGGGLASDKLGNINDTHAIYESAKADDLWIYTPSGTFYNDHEKAYLSCAMGNLILTQDENRALRAELSQNNTLTLYTAQAALPLKFDSENMLFTVADDTDNIVTLQAYSIDFKDDDDDSVEIEDIELSADQLTLTCGESTALTVKIIPENAAAVNIVWTSSDPSVAAVTDGTVEALSKGQAIIRASTEDGLHYAECTVTVVPLTHTVRFLDHDDTVLSEQTVEHGMSAEKPKDPQRTGHTFVGWDKDFSNVTEDMDIHAMYSVNMYTVKFYDGYSGTLLKTALVEYGGSVEPPPVPNRPGYDFLAWTPAGFTRVTRDLDISALWQITTYTIKYNSAGGIMPSGTVITSYTVESPDIPLPIPTKTGYTFVGWHYNEDLSDSAITYIPSGSTGNITLYAEWSATAYYIKYETNGGSILGFAPLSYTVESPDILLPTPTKPGYTFLGWYQKADFSGSTVNVLSSGSTGNRTFYAKWGLVLYKIDYVLNGGYNPTGAPVGYSVESGNIALPVATRNGYTFVGWHTSADLSGSVISVIPAGTIGDIKLYAEWRVNYYSITYMLNGGTNPSGAPMSFTVESRNITLPTPTRTGYTFLGFYDNASFSGDKITYIPSGTTQNITLYAKWEPILYSINFVLNGGQISGAVIGGYTIESNIDLPKPARTAYDFVGWYESANFSGSPVTKISAGTTGQKTFYARWRPTEYDITYHVNGGNMPVQYEKTYNIESPDISLPRAERTGHVLVGWHTDPELSGISQWKISSGSYGDLEYYAKWRAIIYTVTFVDMDDNVISTVRASYGTAVEPPTPPEHEGYTFTGWSEDLSFVYGDMTIKAQYKVTEYDVVFVDIDYAVLSEQRVKHGQAAQAPKPPEHDGMKFAFWSVDFSCVKSNLTVVAIYRTTVITPPTENISDYRFESVNELKDGASYIITAYSNSMEYALSSLPCANGSGLWGLNVKFENAQFTLGDGAAYGLYDIMFDSHSMHDGVMLTSSSAAQSLAGGFGELSLFNYGDEFTVLESGNRLKLYNVTQNNYLCYDNAGGYFYMGSESQSIAIRVHKLLRPKGAYSQTAKFAFGDRYAIVAVRPDGKAYMLSGTPTESGGLIGIEGTIVNNRFYASHDVTEKNVVFRTVGGSDAIGYNIRNAQTSGFLSKTRDGKLIADSDISLMGKWVYKTHPESGKKTLYDEQSGYYLYCSENGEFTADSKITHTEIMLFEHSYIGGNIGDTNGDGRVNGADAILVLRHRVRLQELTGERLRLADANGDGLVNTGDAMYILKYTVCMVDWLGK